MGVHGFARAFSIVALNGIENRCVLLQGQRQRVGQLQNSASVLANWLRITEIRSESTAFPEALASVM